MSQCAELYDTYRMLKEKVSEGSVRELLLQAE